MQTTKKHHEIKMIKTWNLNKCICFESVWAQETECGRYTWLLASKIKNKLKSIKTNTFWNDWTKKLITKREKNQTHTHTYNNYNNVFNDDDNWSLKPWHCVKTETITWIRLILWLFKINSHTILRILFTFYFAWEFEKFD